MLKREEEVGPDYKDRADRFNSTVEKTSAGGENKGTQKNGW